MACKLLIIQDWDLFSRFVNGPWRSPQRGMKWPDLERSSGTGLPTRLCVFNNIYRKHFEGWPMAVATTGQEPRGYLYFGFTTVLSLGDTAPPIKQWNALAVRPDAYFCGGTPVVKGYSFRGFSETPYFLFNTDQAALLPASVDKSQHTPAAVVERMKRHGAICVKSYRESGFGADVGRLPVPSVEMIRAVVAAGTPAAARVPACEFDGGAEIRGGGRCRCDRNGMWNEHQSTAGKLDKGVEPILQAILMRGMGYQPTGQVIRGLGAVLDDGFFADPLLARVYSPKLIAWYRSPEGAWFGKGELGDTPAAVFERVGGYGDAVTGYLARHNARLLFGTDTPSAPIYTNPPGLNGLPRNSPVDRGGGEHRSGCSGRRRSITRASCIWTARSGASRRASVRICCFCARIRWRASRLTTRSIRYSLVGRQYRERLWLWQLSQRRLWGPTSRTFPATGRSIWRRVISGQHLRRRLSSFT